MKRKKKNAELSDCTDLQADLNFCDSHMLENPFVLGAESTKIFQ